MFFQLKLLKRRRTLSQHKLALDEMRFLEAALSADYENGNIRLREGEYQYHLAKAIASFQLELTFPDVKEIIKRLYGEEKTNDIKFIRKIQTILKKMEKSNIVKILPKKRPWELQRYTLSSFKFRDSDKNLVILATDQQIEETLNLLRSMINQGAPTYGLSGIKAKICVLVFIIALSYTTIAWDLLQSVINPIVFIPAFSVAVACSVMLGRILSRD